MFGLALSGLGAEELGAEDCGAVPWADALDINGAEISVMAATVVTQRNPRESFVSIICSP
jgi:hypothetical protein